MDNHTLKIWINTFRNHLVSAYEIVRLRRGVIPTDRNMANLPDAILSIPFGVEFKEVSTNVIELIGATEVSGDTIELPEYIES